MPLPLEAKPESETEIVVTVDRIIHSAPTRFWPRTVHWELNLCLFHPHLYLETKLLNLETQPPHLETQRLHLQIQPPHRRTKLLILETSTFCQYSHTISHPFREISHQLREISHRLPHLHRDTSTQFRNNPTAQYTAINELLNMFVSYPIFIFVFIRSFISI